MAISVVDLITRVRNLTEDKDSSAFRWADSELLDWINDAQLAVSYYLPEASSQERHYPFPDALSYNLTSNSHRLPDDVNRLLSVVCNVWFPQNYTAGDDDDEIIALDAIRLTDRKLLDEATPEWHSSVREAVKTIRDISGGEGSTFTNYAVLYHEYVYDERSPRQYWLTANLEPVSLNELIGKVDGTVGIRAIVSIRPIEVVLDGNLTISDLYINPVLNHVLHRCYTKEAPFANSVEWATHYYDLFMKEVTEIKDSNYIQTPYEERARRYGYGKRNYPTTPEE